MHRHTDMSTRLVFESAANVSTHHQVSRHERPVIQHRKVQKAVPDQPWNRNQARFFLSRSYHRPRPCLHAHPIIAPLNLTMVSTHIPKWRKKKRSSTYPNDAKKNRIEHIPYGGEEHRVTHVATPTTDHPHKDVCFLICKQHSAETVSDR